MKRSYSAVILIPTFEERVRYLSCGGQVGAETFSYLRWVNQELYHSADWLSFRRDIILRDECCDLAHPDYPIDGYYDKEKGRVLNPNKITVHHIEPLLPEDLANNSRKIFDPENVITTSGATHRCIHYGSSVHIPVVIERTPNDTCPWKR